MSNKRSEYRYSQTYRIDGNWFTIRVASRNIVKYWWHRLRGWFEYSRGNSYEYNDIDRM